MSNETKTPVAWRVRKSSGVPWVYWSTKPPNADDPLVDAEPLYLADDPGEGPIESDPDESLPVTRSLGQVIPLDTPDQRKSAILNIYNRLSVIDAEQTRLRNTNRKLCNDVNRPSKTDCLLEERVARLESWRRGEDRSPWEEPGEAKDADSGEKEEKKDPGSDNPRYGVDVPHYPWCPRSWWAGRAGQFAAGTSCVCPAPAVRASAFGGLGFGVTIPSFSELYGDSRWAQGATKTEKGFPTLKAPSRMELLRGALRCSPVPLLVAFTATVMAAFLLGVLMGWRLLP